MFILKYFTLILNFLLANEYIKYITCIMSVISNITNIVQIFFVTRHANKTIKSLITDIIKLRIAIIFAFPIDTKST